MKRTNEKRRMPYVATVMMSLCVIGVLCVAVVILGCSELRTQWQEWQERPRALRDNCCEARNINPDDDCEICCPPGEVPYCGNAGCHCLPIAVAARPPVPQRTFRRMLRLDFVLQDRSQAREREWVMLFSRNARSIQADFDGLVLVAPSWLEFPEAFQATSLVAVSHLARMYGFDVLAGRRLWVTWPELVRGPPVPWDAIYSASYYGAVIQGLYNDADAIGAVSTFVDAEPYGQSPQIGLRKGAEIDLDKMMRAIRQAVDHFGKVDKLKPYGQPAAYSWVIDELCRHPIPTVTTYYAVPPDWQFSKPPKPPDGEVYAPHVWATEWPTVTLEQIRQWSPEAVAEQCPTCDEHLVVVEPADVSDFLRQYGF